MNEEREPLATPLPVEDGAHFLARQLGEPTYVVDQVIPTGGCGFLVGPPKRFKSWLALDLMMAVVMGSPWMGKRTGPPGTALLIDAESIPQRLQERLLLIAMARDAKHEDHKRVNVLSPGRILLTDRGELTRFAETLLILQPTIVVLDCFARFHGLDENSASEVAPFLGNLRDAATAAGSSLLIVHHRGKAVSNGPPDGRLLRGSSDLHGWYDYAIFVDGQADDIQLHFESRYCEPPEPLTASLRVVPNMSAGFTWGEKDATLPERILEELDRAGPDGLSAVDLVPLVGVARSTVLRFVDQLLATGRVNQASEQRRGTGRPTTIYRSKNSKRQEISLDPEFPSLGFCPVD